MTEKTKPYQPFTFLDRDLEAEAEITRAETWLRDVKEWQAARRWRREGDKDE